ncbi:MAG: hypothetical protein GY894_05975 [Planctomycetes bacterium]|nr:hypothetical protein [Planctomycetota bacterium]MCP4838895.1 hypothetical protein [Planctomycetota bacterium]
MTGPGKPPGTGIPGAGRVFQVIQSQPGSASRIAMIVFLLIIALPLLLLGLIAAAVSVAVFLVLSGWNRLFGKRSPDWAKHDAEGRKGVRVRR